MCINCHKPWKNSLIKPIKIKNSFKILKVNFIWTFFQVHMVNNTILKLKSELFLLVCKKTLIKTAKKNGIGGSFLP